MFLSRKTVKKKKKSYCTSLTCSISTGAVSIITKVTNRKESVSKVNNKAETTGTKTQR